MRRYITINSIAIIITVFGISSCCENKSTTPSTTDMFEIVQTNTTVGLTDISFTDNNNGIICGEYGFCAKTIDGGSTWTTLNTSIPVSLTSAFMLNKQHFYLARKGIYKTNNAGSSFYEIGSLSQTQSMTPCIFFRDTSVGFITKENAILKTLDGGSTWNIVYTSDVPYLLYGLQFINNSIGYASGGRTFDQVNDGEIAKTTNGGESWTKIASTKNVTSLNFVNAELGYYTNFNQEVYKTSDGGKTWLKVSVLKYYPVSSVFISEQIGYIGTYEGKILKTKNGGQTWDVVYEKTSEPIAKIYKTTNKIFAVGNNGQLLILHIP